MPRPQDSRVDHISGTSVSEVQGSRHKAKGQRMIMIQLTFLKNIPIAFGK